MAMRSKIDDTKALVASRGGWRAVYSHYPNLFEAFNRPGKEFPCPRNGDGKTKFSFFKDCDIRGAAFHRDFGGLPDGIEVIAWYEGISKSQAMDIIIDICGGKQRLDPHAIKKVKQLYQQTAEISKEVAEKRRTIINRIWEERQPVRGSVAETYLQSRGLRGLNHCRDVYFHPSLPYKEDDKAPWQRFPGLISVVRNADRKKVTLHRTFLAPDGKGKAPVTRQKMMLAQPRNLDGACIMLDSPIQTPFGGLIGVCEGIETALSIREATGCPMWVGISDRIMEKMRFDASISTIVVWADIEPSGAGIRAACNMHETWEKQGKNVIIRDPSLLLPREKVDFNDVYVELGAKAFDFHLPVQGVAS